MKITMSLKYYRDIIFKDIKIEISKIHLESSTPSMIRGYGGYGWIVTTNKNVNYRFFRKNNVIDEGTISSKIILKPNGGKIEEYFLVFNIIQ